MERSPARDGAPPPIAIIDHVGLDVAAREKARAHFERKLAKYAPRIQRIFVRFEDENGPRGGIGTRCRVEVVMRRRPSIVAEARAGDAGRALRRVGDTVVRAVRREAQRHAFASRSRGGRDTTPRRDVGRPAPPRSDDDGSLIGRRVGRSRKNLARALARPEKERRDAYVDTSAPGVSASARKAGYGASAARNTKARTAGMTATLEDSRKKPSRKSTRRSANRAKSATAIAHRETLRQRSPQARARKSQAQRARPR